MKPKRTDEIDIEKEIARAGVLGSLYDGRIPIKNSDKEKKLTIFRRRRKSQKIPNPDR